MNIIGGDLVEVRNQTETLLLIRSIISSSYLFFFLIRNPTIIVYFVEEYLTNDYPGCKDFFL